MTLQTNAYGFAPRDMLNFNFKGPIEECGQRTNAQKWKNRRKRAGMAKEKGGGAKFAAARRRWGNYKKRTTVTKEEEIAVRMAKGERIAARGGFR